MLSVADVVAKTSCVVSSLDGRDGDFYEESKDPVSGDAKLIHVCNNDNVVLSMTCMVGWLMVGCAKCTQWLYQ